MDVNEFMNAFILAIGDAIRIRKKLLTMLCNISNLSFAGLDGSDDIVAYLNTHRTNAVFLQVDTNSTQIIQNIRNVLPTIPIVMYGEGLSAKQTRHFFLNDVLDVLDLNAITLDELCLTVEQSLDPYMSRDHSERLHQDSRIEVLAKRGSHFEQQLMDGTPPAFYMNGNRAVLLRANVISIDAAHLWEHRAVLDWINVFGVSNSFCFSKENEQIRLGAIVEQDYVNAVSFRRMITSKLDSYFEDINAYHCIAAAAYISSDLLSNGVFRHLGALVNAVFYMKRSTLLCDNNLRSNMGIPSDILNQLYSAVAVKDSLAFSDILDKIIEMYCKGMPNVLEARNELRRLFWNCIVLVGDRESYPTDLSLHESSIFEMQKCISDQILTTFVSAQTTPSTSPLAQILQRIDNNPGLATSIDQVAQELNFSRSHFCRLFRKETGMSFSEYLTSRRISAACDLLLRTHMSITDISNSVGFTNVYYFKKIFQKEKGTKIEVWREEHAKRI